MKDLYQNCESLDSFPTIYPGGKNGPGVFQFLINRIPVHDVYIEPFLGSGAVMRNKKFAAISFGVELSVNTFNRWAGHSLPGLTVINDDAISWMRSFDWSGNEFVYCDPPYLMSTRTSGEIYDHEMTDSQHMELLSLLLEMQAAGVKIMLSGYNSSLYSDYLCNWRYDEFDSMTRGGLRTEGLWMSYPVPESLHDYSYLGDGFRERERISRKVKRNINRLKRLPSLERQAILEAIYQEFG